MTTNLEEMEKRAREVYAKLQGEVPEVFKNPDQFNKNVQKLDPTMDPHKLIYRTSNREYGNFNPTLIEMPTMFKGKGENFVKEQNYQIYRDSRMNCAMDKHRFIDKK
ncbi:Conserved_hypothetical protein [Hexamita inflata]|uniref:Uncharacterized protein n=1 Tax=Hexamita inflata TaxID=28002 RepID=A0AA86R7A3_9EUKA|nr:Conserved hypothetical protein [Hexamita inflata]